VRDIIHAVDAKSLPGGSMRNPRRAENLADRQRSRPKSARGDAIKPAASGRAAVTSAAQLSLSPEDLVRGCLRGEDRAWRLFLERYGRLITTVIVRSGASMSDAEEVYQNTVQAIFLGLARLQDSGKIVSWIAGIARRQTYFFLRSRSRETIETTDAMADFHDPAPLPTDELESLQRSQLVLEALKSLRPRCRDLLTALYLDESEASYKEVEKTLGVPYGSIGPTRARCLDALREALIARGYRSSEPAWR
jgi:RNA polymerase sigma factor (sigma-70 family)